MNVELAGRGTLQSVAVYRCTESSNAAGSTSISFDLSSNELALPLLPSVLAVIEEGFSQLARYPDPTARALTEEIASHLCVSTNMCGSCREQKCTATVLPGFGDYVERWCIPCGPRRRDEERQNGDLIPESCRRIRKTLSVFCRRQAS